MSGFSLVLQDTSRGERLEGLTSFVGEDASGHFGILPNHARCMTVLNFGLARFRCGPAPWQYLALPGALLYFVNNELRITTRHYLRHDDYQQVSRLLAQELMHEEQELSTTKESLHRMEEALMRHLRALQ
jgi:F-type H+-transporting ATPase subunit epsilon